MNDPDRNRRNARERERRRLIRIHRYEDAAWALAPVADAKAAKAVAELLAKRRIDILDNNQYELAEDLLRYVISDHGDPDVIPSLIILKKKIQAAAKPIFKEATREDKAAA